MYYNIRILTEQIEITSRKVKRENKKETNIEIAAITKIQLNSMKERKLIL